MQQVLFYVPGIGLPVYGFGVMLFVAFISCYLVAVRRAPREGVKKEVLQDLALCLFVGGLLGARTVYLLLDDNGRQSWTTFWDFLQTLPRIWEGGIVLYGSFAGGVVAYLIFYRVSLRKKGVSTLVLADLLAPMLALGLFFGRIGCFLNGCCYGQVACEDCLRVHYPLSAPARFDLVNKGHQTNAGFTVAPSADGRFHPMVGAVQPGSEANAAGLRSGDRIVQVDGKTVESVNDLNWALMNPEDKGRKDLTLTVRRAGIEQQLTTFQPHTLGLHPTQLYEAVIMGVLFLLLLAFHPLRRSDGQVMALMMICYGVHRAFNEMLRRDERPEGFEAYVSWILAGAGVALMAWLWYRPVMHPRPTAEELAKEAADTKS